MGVQKKTKALAKGRDAVKQTVKQTEGRCRRMIAKLQDYAIIFLSKDGMIEGWNKGAEKIKGYTAEEALGKDFGFFIPLRTGRRRYLKN